MRRDQPGTVLTTLDFTEVVGSTQIAEELGDRRRRDRRVRVELRRVRAGVGSRSIPIDPRTYLGT